MEWRGVRFTITKDICSFKAGEYWVESVAIFDGDEQQSAIIRRGKENYCNIQSPDYLQGLLDAGVLIKVN